MLANTPKPPYYAVIFSSILGNDQAGYEAMANKMVELAHQQEGFLGIESARQEVGITVSYWQDLEAIKNWKANAQHKIAQQLGNDRWYADYRMRIALVDKAYSK